MSKPSVICLSSEFRQPGETAQSFTIVLPQPVVGAQKITVSRMSVINFVYPFKSSNNTVVAVSGAGTFSVDISTTRFFDTGTDFATHLTSLFTTAGSTITATYDTDNFRLSLAGGGDGAFTLVGTSTVVLEKLGYGSNTDNTTSQTTHAALNPLNLLGTSCILVRSDVIGGAGGSLTPSAGYLGGTDGADIWNLIEYIPVTVAYGSVITNQTTDASITVESQRSSFQQLSIQLLDDDFEPLNIDDNCKFFMWMHVKY